MSELIKAILDHDVGKIEHIMAAGVDLDEPDDLGRTAIMEATIQGCANIVKILTRAGANVNASDQQGFTALHFAALEHHIGIGRELIESGAKLDSVDVYGNTPLWRAVFASRGRGEMVCLLLDAGADRNIKNSSGVSPIDLATNIGNYNIRQFFSDR